MNVTAREFRGNCLDINPPTQFNVIYRASNILLHMYTDNTFGSSISVYKYD